MNASVQGASKSRRRMSFDTILLIIAGIVGVLLVAVVAYVLLFLIGWMNKGSH
jgi:hypothetical protein